MMSEKGSRANSPECPLKAERCGNSGKLGCELFTRFGLCQESIAGGGYGIARASTQPILTQAKSTAYPLP